MSTAKRLHYTYREYLQALEVSPLKLEYCDGVIYAMAGWSPAHAALAARVISLLGQALGPGCTVFSSDLKVRIETTDLSTFPDAAVVCGPVKTAAGDDNAVVNPAVLVEITSPSTEDYDRGDKLSNYRQLPSLQVVMIVSHRERRVTLHTRTGTSWEEREVRAGELLTVDSPAFRFGLDLIYDRLGVDGAP